MRKLIIAVMAALSLAALPAHADRGYGHGGHGHRGGDGAVWAGLAVFGALAGLAIMAERSRAVQVAPAYVEPVYSAPAPVAPENRYYCQSSEMYYPYTDACPEGWQVVPARPY